MKDSTRNKRLLEMFGPGYIVFVPNKDRNGYTMLSNKADQNIRDGFSSVADKYCFSSAEAVQ